MSMSNVFKRITCAALLLAFLLMAAPFIGGASLGAAKADETSSGLDGTINGRYVDFHGIPLPADSTLEAYSLTVPTNDNAIYFCTDPVPFYFLNGSTDRHEVVSLLCTFPNIKVDLKGDGELYVFRVMVTTKLFIGSIWARNIKFTEDLYIGLTNNYYKYFLKMEEERLDFSGVQFDVIKNARGSDALFNLRKCPLDIFNIFSYTNKFDFDCVLNSVNVPVDVIDVESPDFDVDFGNTGTNLAPDDNSDAVDGLNFWQWLLETLQGSNGQFLQIIMWAIIVFLAIIALGCVVFVGRVIKAVLSFLFGK